LSLKCSIYAHMKAAFDELPGISVTRLRAIGDVMPAMKTTTVKLGDIEFVVELLLHKFRNGGSWSLFRCPGCSRRARILRLLEGRLACCRCCKAHGLHARVELIATAKRAAYLAPKRLARLNSDTPARLFPRPSRMLDRRANLEFALRRSRIVVRRHGLDRAKDQGL
jgi:hypothetical protein